MCGRYTLTASGDALVEAFDLLEEPEHTARYNIAPTQEVAIVRQGRQGRQGRELSYVRWGLIPGWAKDPSIGNRMINARGETVAEKPSFRAAFKRRRCLVLADGFYEWRKLADGSKQPYHLRLKGGGPFAIAGLWESWRDKMGPDDPPIESCTLITTSPNELTAQVHDRMPVILHRRDYDTWLDPSLSDRPRLESLIATYPAEEMEFFPVSKRVNSPRNDVPECIVPIEEVH